MNWLLLILAGFFEVGFATCLGKAKESAGTTATLWMVGFFVCLSISMFLLYKVTQSLPIGTAYAVWTGLEAWELFWSAYLFLKSLLLSGEFSF